MMIELDDGALLIVPVLFLSAANRQHMIEANSDIPLPESQHWFQIVCRESDVDHVLCQLHLPTVDSNDVLAIFSETSQSLASAAAPVA